MHWQAECVVQGMDELGIERAYAARQHGGTYFDFAFSIGGTVNVVGALCWLKSENREDLENCIEQVCRCTHCVCVCVCVTQRLWSYCECVACIRCYGCCHQLSQTGCDSSATAVQLYQGRWGRLRADLGWISLKTSALGTFK